MDNWWESRMHMAGIFIMGFAFTFALEGIGVGPDVWHNMLLGFVIAHTWK